MTNFLRFLEFVHDRKDKHVSQYGAEYLQCFALQTHFDKLATLALYAQASLIIYRQIRKPNSKTTNMLDWGPLHLKVEQHIDKIISNPELLISENATYTTGAIDGKEWETPDAVAAILKMAPELPHLSNLVVEFFTGA